MQGGSTQEDNVVSIFSRKNAEKKSDSKESATENLSFTEVMQRNNDNVERLRKEREKANRNVIRSYRLKPR